MENEIQSYKKMFDSNPMAFCILKIERNEAGQPCDFTFVYVNKACAEIYELPLQVMTGNSFYQMFPQADGRRLPIYARVAFEGERVDFRTVIMEIDKYVSISAYRVLDGYCGVYVQNFSRWITLMRKHAHKTDGDMFFYDRDNHHLYLSKNAMQKYGILHRYGTVDYVLGGFTDRRQIAALKDHMTMFEYGMEEFSQELLLADGRYISITMKQNSLEQKEPATMAVGYLEDITRKKQEERKREQLKANLEYELIQAKQESQEKYAFLSHVSHDMRTPVHAIVGYTTIAATHLKEPERVQDCLKKISVSSKHILNLINDVIDIARMDSGKSIIQEKNCDLMEVLQNPISMVRPRFMQGGSP